MKESKRFSYEGLKRRKVEFLDWEQGLIDDTNKWGSVTGYALSEPSISVVGDYAPVGIKFYRSAGIQQHTSDSYSVYYDAVGEMMETTTYSQGTYIEEVVADENAYTNNARNTDGYWYEKIELAPSIFNSNKIIDKINNVSSIDKIMNSNKEIFRTVG